MENSAEIYEELIRLVEAAAVPVAVQIREEIARGRFVKSSKLPEEERRERQSRLSEAKLGRISDEEIAVMPYNGDERLALLCETVLTLTKAMAASRRAVLAFAREHGVESRYVEFADADELDTGAAHLDLERDSADADRVFRRVQALLEPVRQEVGTWQ